MYKKSKILKFDRGLLASYFEVQFEILDLKYNLAHIWRQTYSNFQKMDHPNGVIYVSPKKIDHYITKR